MAATLIGPAFLLIERCRWYVQSDILMERNWPWQSWNSGANGGKSGWKKNSGRRIWISRGPPTAANPVPSIVGDYVSKGNECYQRLIHLYFHDWRTWKVWMWRPTQGKSWIKRKLSPVLLQIEKQEESIITVVVRRTVNQLAEKRKWVNAQIILYWYDAIVGRSRKVISLLRVI